MNEHTELTDDELLDGIATLLTTERAGLACLVQDLAEVENRRLHLAAAFSSMFEFCTRRLRLSEGEAFRRLTAARLARKFPAIIGLIENGSIHLSALVRLRDHLTDANHAELLREASGKSKRELEQLLAARFPQADAPPRIRKLPQPRQAQSQTESLPLSAAPPQARRPPASSPAPPLFGPVQGPVARLRRAPRGRERRSRLSLGFTASEALKDKLERAQRLMSHANPGGDLAAVVERAIDLLERTLTSTAREILTLRRDTRSIADQYHVSGVDVPPPVATSAHPASTAAPSWNRTTRSGCSREAHAELVQRRESERKAASSALLQRLAGAVFAVFRLKP